ncbi:MAG: prolipoprotein diacylglyceryl transferase [Flavobacteriales bacterium]
MFLPLYIDWKVDPNLLEDPVTIRWYGLFFALAFLLGHKLLERIFKNEGVSEKQLDKVLIYTMVGTIIGARLGHVIFYDPQYYWENLAEIPKIWKGGLASHGGAIGIILALWLFSRWVSKRSILWILDRVVVPIALGGMFIRFGNLMNHEIVGAKTSVPWAFVFDPSYCFPCGPSPDPRHPSQIYEALAYLAIFAILFRMYWVKKAYLKEGLLLGSFLTLVFSARFIIEFVKDYQAEFLEGWFLTMGQLLSIPFILAGVLLVYRAQRRGVGMEKTNEREAEEPSS